MYESIELRCRMVRAGVDQMTLAGIIKRSPAYVGARINGHRPWDMNDVYRICDALRIPYEDIPVVFPPPGRKKTGKDIMEVKGA